MNNNVLELKGVTVQKAKKRLLDRISFNVSSGEFVGIIGPNGAGKTTLLNVMAGFEKFEGELNLFGQAETWRRCRKTRLRIGYVPQMFQVDPSFPMRTLEAVMTGAVGRAGLFKSPDIEDKARALKLMEMMRMTHILDAPLGHLSGGERQKVSLARAIIQKPDMLLLDEPTANLDIAVQKEVLDLVCEIHRMERITLFLVTHDFSMIPGSMDRALLLNNGKVVFDGDIDTAMSGDVLTRLFEYPLETFKRNGKRFISYG